jgi:hypothetical protein
MRDYSDAKGAAVRGLQRSTRVCLCAFTLAMTGSGCAFGPKALEKTHGRYQESVLLVEEEQFLRNVVHLRYSEPRRSLSISSIATQYELAGGAEARPFFVAPNSSNGIFKTFTSVLPDVNVTGANRPTITLIPSNDSDPVRRSLTPISLDTIALLTETSWPAAVIMRLWIERLNGVPNAVSASGPSRGMLSDYARFQRIAELMQYGQDNEIAALRNESHEVELGGPVAADKITPSVVLEAAKAGMEYRPRQDGKGWVIVKKENKLFLRINPLAIGSPAVEELTALLNVEPSLPQYEVVVAPGIVADPLRSGRAPTAALRMMPRSTSQVLYYLANGVEVPPEHVACGYVKPIRDPTGNIVDPGVITRDLFAVHVSQGHKPPPNAYVAIRYRGCWYYVDDRDQSTKATITLMLQLNRLDFANEQPAAPFLTLPIGR